MVIASTSDLLQELTRWKVLDTAQRDELLGTARFVALSPRAAAQELLQRGWLTPYQVNRIFQGRGGELLLGSYVLLEKLGEGGMGAVFKTRNWKLNKVVALKLVRKERLANVDAIRRFHREIRAAAQLAHPNIVRAIDADEVNGTVFFVMEYVDGTDLARVVKERGPLPIADACEYIRQAALGLQHAHERGMVHRDIKPANLLVVNGGLVSGKTQTTDHSPLTTHHSPLLKILDMGLARVAHTESEESTTLTQEGAFMGTPDYSAPEQALRSHEVDIRADVYSLGCSLYYLLAGGVPFPRGSLAEKLLKHQMQEPTPVEELRPATPPVLAAMVRRAMAKQPADRYQTPAELAEALETFLRGVASPLPKPAPNSPTVPAAGDSKTEETARHWADAVAPSATAPIVALPPRRRHRRPYRITAVIGVALFVLVLLAIWRPWQTATQDGPVSEKKPPPAKPSEADLARQAERDRQKKIDDTLFDLATRTGSDKADWPALRQEVRDFAIKHSGTPAATRACELLGQVLPKIPSPLDALDAKKLPQDCLEHWRAVGREPPGELVGVLGEHRRRHWNGIRSLACSPDGKWIASADGWSLRLWDATTGKAIAVVTTACQAIAFRSDSKALVTAHDTGTTVWDVPAGRPSAVIGGGLSGYAIAYSPDGRFLATATREGEVVLRDAQSGKELNRLATGEPHVFSLAFSRDSQLLAAGANKQEGPGKLKLWNLASRKEHLTIAVDDVSRALAFDAHGKTLACGGNGVTLWDAVTGKKLTQPVARTYGQVDSLAFAEDGKILAVSCTDGNIYLWAPGQEKLRSLSGHAGPVTGVDFLPGTQTLVSGGADGTVRLWDVATGKEVQPLTGRVGTATCLAFSLDNTRLLVGGTDKIVGLLDIATSNELFRYDGHPSAVWHVAFFPDGERALSCCGTETAHWVDLTGAVGKDRQLLPGGGAARCVTIALDGQSAACGQANGDVALWRFSGKEKKLQAVLTGHTKSVEAIALSPNSRMLASAGWEAVKLWELNGPDPKVRAALRCDDGLPEWVAGMAFAPDGESLAVGYQFPRQRIQFWNLTRPIPEPGAATQAHRNNLSSLAYAPDGKRIASAGLDGRIILSDAISGTKLHEWQLPGAVYGIAFAHDGRHLATANGNGTVYIFRIPPVANAPGSPIKALSAEEAKKQQEDEAKRLSVPVQIENSIGMKLNLIPAGRFLMGSPEDEPGRQANEGPQHEVVISKPFHIGVYEVTQAEYEKVTGTNPAHFNKDKAGGPDHPLETVSWPDAVAFCKRLSELPEEKKAGRVYRMPTEAEWEYACRTGTQTAYSFGDDAGKLGEYAWHLENAENKTHPVGRKLPNPWGLYDMHGNVAEWVAENVVRGGSSLVEARHTRSAVRSHPGGYRANEVGFRVVCEVQPAADREK